MASNPAIALLLQLWHPAGRVAELGSLDGITRMVITVDNFFSLEVAAWLTAASAVVALVWRVARRVQPMWLRIFVRAAAITLGFAPLPHVLMFTEEGAKAGLLIITPLWYALFRAIADGIFLGAGVVLLFWLMATYFFWVAGMSIHRLLGRANDASSETRRAIC